MRIIELFAGIGTVTQALKELGAAHEVVAISEIDRFAVQSYTALHGAPNNLGDIRKIGELPAAELWFYGFCCQDISVAGKLAGIKTGTRSGLLLEVERLLKAAAEGDSLPKYLILENVKNLVGRRFKPDFERWLCFLESLGYTNYAQILNTRDYCIPQNRERVFCVSIRGEHTPFVFPQKRTLSLRLRDMLDEVVDEHFYLTERALKSLGHSTYNQERTRLQDADGVHRTCCGRDYKSPSCVQVGTLSGGKWDKQFKMGRRVYDTDGLSPTVHTCGGGNTELKIVDDTYKGRAAREYYDVCPNLRADRHGFKVSAGKKQPVNHKYKEEGVPRAEHIEFRDDELAGTVMATNDNHFVGIVAMRGRNPDNPNDRTAGMPSVQRLEFSDFEVSHCLSTVQKDNLLAEAPYITDEDSTASKCVRAGGHGLHLGHTWDVIASSARIRKLTPIECLRLQGWRDREIRKIKAAGVSNAQMYRQAGNGITTTVLIAIFGELLGLPYEEILENWRWDDV